jgi:predicted CoA-substrate-specific enzyme activase
MLVAGVDAGSRAIKLVVLDTSTDGVAFAKKAETTFDPLSQARRLMEGVEWDRLAVTGYGRRLVADAFDGMALTEIQAHALGAAKVCPQVGSVLDIGGQDTKAISLDPEGRVRKFEMNDRCAAGTGKFLEFMARGFGIPIEDFGDFALQGEPGITINSMCAVFAETEATSLTARGRRPQDIALALHVSVLKRSLSMLKRIAVRGPLLFSGGVARNPCVKSLLREAWKDRTVAPRDPDFIGALGAAVRGSMDGVPD